MQGNKKLFATLGAEIINRAMKWKILLVFNLFIGCLSAQSLDTIRIACTTNLVLVIPSEYGDTLYNYEEGFFRTFFWASGDILDIQCGSMSEPIYLSDTTRFEVIQTCVSKENEIVTGVEIQSGKSWGVVKFLGQRIKVSYICSPERKSIYEDAIQCIILE
jgi:hypothetical protein